jgi:hypothetical protein
MTHKFVKEYGRWYIDLPQWTGSKGDLLMVAGADTLLEKLSENNDEVAIALDVNPFESANVMKMLFKTPVVGGATYRTDNGHLLWLCKVTEFVFGGSMPKSIYFKKL